MDRDGTKVSLNSHGFAIALTSFVGRSGEVTEVTDLLAEYRMVTVTGPGGMGKTRLADKVARGMAAEFADGIWFAELAAVRDPSLVLAQVAAALGMPADGSETIAEMLARRQQLLVLDNCEHVLEPVAQLCAAILGTADDVRILATSREPLGVPGEARYRLRPLSLPTGSGTEGVPESDAVILFADRARHADSRFAISTGNLPAVARLVRRLDGMPLAIELAAARVESLGLAQLADGIDDRLRLLGSTSHTMPGRQRSLTATADWSYRLLPADEQRAFRMLAVFPGGFTLDAAGAVAGQDVAAAVLHLVDSSMIAPPQQGTDGRARYAMLETLRAYGRDKLAEAGDSDQAAKALAAFAVSVAEQASPMLATADDVAALRWLDAEAACLQQATTWSLRTDPATALRLAVSLASWWQLRGHYRLGYEILSQVADVAEPGGQDWRAAQLWLGILASAGLGAAQSLPHITALIAAFEDGEPNPMLVRALCTRGGALANLGRLDEAEPLVRRALDLARRIDDAFGQANALYWLSGISHYRGDQAESLRWARQLDSLDQARVPRRMWIRGLMGQIIPLFEAGEYAEARQLSATTLDLSRSARDSSLESEALFHLARIELEAGNATAARLRLSEALTSRKQVWQPIGMLDLLDVCGHYLARAGAPAAALTIWAAQAALLEADQISDPIEDTRRRHEPQLKARKEVGQAGTRAAETRGAAMTLPVATEFALLALGAGEQPEPAGPSSAPPVGSEHNRTGLSPREQELVVLVARGLTDAQIARQLFISVSTVRSHLDRIRDKTGCRRRADLTRLALQAGLA